MAKQYLLSITAENGVKMNIIAQTDNTKPIYVYFDGQDTGRRYISVGYASRYLETIAHIWGKQTIKEYGTVENIPLLGSSEWNKQLFRYYYCGGAFPSSDLV